MSLFSMTFLRARPYGSLGPLEWQQRDGLVFGGLHGRNDLQPIADRILTYTEQREHGDVRVQISEALTEAELIIFIGFGFHQQNMMLLKPHNRETKRQVFATAVGIHKDNHELYQRTLQENFGEPVRLFERKGGELLSALRPSIMAAAAS